MKILSFAQLKGAEQNAVTSGKASFEELMKTAGEGAAREIISRYDILGKNINVVCGSGNNGGDGLVVAKILHSEGAKVTVTLPFGVPSTETAGHFTDVLKTVTVTEKVDTNADITVDALFGIGLNRPPRDIAAEVIADMNKAQGVKIALDLPSGIYCDGGHGGTVFSADLTVTFIALKTCFVLPDTSSYCGEVVLCDLGLEPREYTYETIRKPSIEKRDKNSHKGSFGTAFLVCGSYGMCGAAILSAKSCYRSGTGLVKAVVCDKNYTAFASSLPEAVTIPVETDINGAPVVYDKTLFSGLSSAGACLLGCGLGRSDGAVKLVTRTLEYTEIPTVLDADGINNILKDIDILRRVKAPLILTPHPAEMARLCGTTVSDIEHNRIRYAKSFAAEYGVVLVLKGANTIVASPDGRIFFNTSGNAGMATAGSGDVLSGIIVSYLAQGKDALTSALRGVYFHGVAGDYAARNTSESFMNASDIIEGLKYI